MSQSKGLGGQDFSTIIEAYLLDPKGLNHRQKLCATIFIASHGCINAIAMGHGHLCYILYFRLLPTIIFVIVT